MVYWPLTLFAVEVNRVVLQRIKESGDIFWAQSDRDWILDGAAVNVAMVGFDNGTERQRELDDGIVSSINSDLTSTVDLTTAKILTENNGISFQGPSPKAPFDIEEEMALKILSAPLNPNRRSNADVVKPLIAAIDLAQGSRRMWTIDFGVMGLEEAAMYEMPFEYVKKNVLPVRKTRRDDYRGQWWQYARPRPEMRAALQGKKRYIVTPRHSKHRLFVWANANMLCNRLYRE